MRKLFFLLLLISSAILGGLVYLVSTLIALLFETGLSSAIDPHQLVTQHGIDEEHRPIPKIIHQTWKNETIPEDWSIAQYACLDLHPDYQYIVSPNPRKPINGSYGRMRRVGNSSRLNIHGFYPPLIHIRIIFNERT